jgi:hypothetical protein
MSYPKVMTEEETIHQLVTGKYHGLARYGDGDFNIMRGQRDRYHKPCHKLAEALATSLHRGHNKVLNCLIPPPVAREGTLAYQRWHNYVEMNSGIFPFLIDEYYGSSNISRMDSQTHLHTTSWWLTVSKLWQDKAICLVRGSERSLTAEKLWESPNVPKSIFEVRCKHADNFDQLDELYTKICEVGIETVILCSGLVTRPLVHKLVGAGLKAYDLGHIGLWFKNGSPIPLQDCPR